MDPKERYHDKNEATRVALDGRQSSMYTAEPGIIVSVNLAAATVVVQPAIKRLVRKHDGTSEFTQLPLIPDVPIQFQRGGGYSMTFPVKAGDECLLVFSSREIDNWWDKGGVQQPNELRMHDLSDAFALVGSMSKPKIISSIHSANAQFRSDDGSVHVEIDGAGGICTITAPTQINLNAPIVRTTGQVQAAGEITAGFGGGNAVHVITHRHQNVQFGNDQSGPPVPGS